MQQIAQYCSDEQTSCLSAAVVFGVPQYSLPDVSLQSNHAAPTTVHTDTVPTMAQFFFTFVQVTSVYLILCSVVMLVVLELFELRYLRQLLQVKMKRA